MIYQQATWQDASLLAEYRLRFAIELSGPQEDAVISALRSQLTSYFTGAAQDRSCISIIAKEGEQVAGIGSLHIRHLPGSIRNISGVMGYIMNMYTVPEYRRRGVCTGILKQLVEHGKSRGITAFELHATSEGEPVYLKSGFKIHNEPTLRLIF